MPDLRCVNDDEQTQTPKNQVIQEREEELQLQEKDKQIKEGKTEENEQ
jgi:hypothetical protein